MILINIVKWNGRKKAKMSDNEYDIQLRNIELDDARILMELNNNIEISSYVVGTPNIVTYDQQLKWMDSVKFEKNTVRWMITWNNITVGTIILSNIDKNNCVGNMNIKILPLYHGKGIAQKALKIACTQVFKQYEIYCITAHVLEYNLKSQKLFERVGFKKEGTLRGRVLKEGKRCNLIAYSLLKTEWL